MELRQRHSFPSVIFLSSNLGMEEGQFLVASRVGKMVAMTMSTTVVEIAEEWQDSTPALPSGLFQCDVLNLRSALTGSSKIFHEILCHL